MLQNKQTPLRMGSFEASAAQNSSVECGLILSEQLSSHLSVRVMQVTHSVAILARWMAADLYLREVDALRFELSQNHASDEVHIPALRRNLSSVWDISTHVLQRSCWGAFHVSVTSAHIALLLTQTLS